MTAAGKKTAFGLPARTAAVAGLLIVLAAVLLVAAYNRASFRGLINGAIQSGTSHATEGFNSVSTLLAGRSPGERAAGLLAMLKPARKPELHERALPKVRLPGQPVLPAGILGAPAIFPVDTASLAPPQLYTLLGLPGGQTPLVEVPELVTSPPGSPVIVPPVVTPLTPLVPLTPVSAAPEPSSWMMLLIGFAAIGQAMRRRRVRLGSVSQ